MHSNAPTVVWGPAFHSILSDPKQNAVGKPLRTGPDGESSAPAVVTQYLGTEPLETLLRWLLLPLVLATSGELVARGIERRL